MEEELDRSTCLRRRHPKEKLPRDINCKKLDVLYQTPSDEMVKVNGLYKKNPPSVILSICKRRSIVPTVMPDSR